MRNYLYKGNNLTFFSLLEFQKTAKICHKVMDTRIYPYLIKNKLIYTIQS